MRELNKKGLSGVVATVLLVVLILVAIVTIWVVVGNLIDKSVDKISLDSLTLDLEIVSARINFSNGEATIRVRRNTGGGDIVGIKFLVQDTLGSDIFERKFTSFEELEERTFILDLTQSEFLLLTDIYKISIATIYESVSGQEELITSISDSVEGLNSQIDNPREIPQEEQINYCTDDLGCANEVPTNEDPICNGDLTETLQAVYSETCISSVCGGTTFSLITKDICLPEEHCEIGICVLNDVACTTSTVIENCGTDGLIGNLDCSQSGLEVVQDYKTWSCVDNLCRSTTVEQTQEICADIDPTYECVAGVCTDVPECTSDTDCLPEEICNTLGVCELEIPLNNGTVLSIWPFSLGEYFDSPDLPIEAINGNYKNNYIIFPQSEENRCLLLTEHVYPEIGTNNNAYVRMNESQTNISSGVYYEIWQRDYICSQTSYYL